MLSAARLVKNPCLEIVHILLLFHSFSLSLLHVYVSYKHNLPHPFSVAHMYIFLCLVTWGILILPTSAIIKTQFSK